MLVWTQELHGGTLTIGGEVARLSPVGEDAMSTSTLSAAALWQVEHPPGKRATNGCGYVTVSLHHQVHIIRLRGGLIDKYAL